ncbi:M23 family metallopeptidase [Flavobacteriaceae bacterium LSUCC0859]|nr:M23 family metallopeptidase [Flavobacteriaceae bacterium LSUCC0859]
MKFLYFLCVLSFCCSPLWSQAAKEYSPILEIDTYSPPLKITPILAGNFGELRSNHFHAGLDIKTLHKEGFKVHAIADGYVSRIKISHWGYGKAIYIRHKNGLSSVYAHLQKFSPEIEAYINDMQYKRKSYTLEVFPKENALPVFKDSLIAYSGNTGGSTAPHLHFEMRKAGTAIALNPIKYQDIKDQTPPEIQKVYVYPKTHSSHVNQSEKKIQLAIKKITATSYKTDEIRVKGDISFGIKAYDRQDLAANKNGIYTYKLYKNDSLRTLINFENFSFYETSYINTLIDYEHLIKAKERILLLDSEQATQLSVVKSKKNEGIVTLNPGERAKIDIVMEDFHGNSTRINIPVIGVSDSSIVKKEIIKTPFPIYHKSPAHFKLSKASVYFPAKSFYKDEYLHIVEKDQSISIHHHEVPLHKNYTLSFKPKDSGWSKYSYIAYQLNNNQFIYSPTKKDQGWLSTKTKKLGTFVVKQDSVPPSIEARNFKPNQNIKNYQYLSLSIKDLETGIKKYEAYLNDQWILMEYEPKRNTITHHIGHKTPLDKENKLEVRVTDMLDNTTTFSTNLQWK